VTAATKRNPFKRKVTGSRPDPLRAVLDRLKGVRRHDGVDGFEALCPAHADKRPSLSVNKGDDGKVLLCCHAGCTTEAVVRNLGMKMSDLFADANDGISHAKAKGMLVEIYDYTDEAGILLFQTLRYDPKDFNQRRPDGKGGWIWSLQGTKRVLYRLPELLQTPSEQIVYVAEGEKDVDNLRHLGLCATCNPMGAGKWKSIYNEALRGRQVVILGDNDKAGDEHAAHVKKSLQGVAASVTILKLPNLPHKGDVSDWIAMCGTAQKLAELVRGAESEDAESEEVAADDGPLAECGYQFAPITSAEFFTSNYKPEWLVKRLLVKKQPVVFGAPKKHLKTTIAVDLGVSLDTKTPFLGEFDVYHRQRVAIISGESGPHALQQMALRVCSARGVDPSTLNILWGFKLPQLANAEHIEALCHGLKEHGVEVLIIDPLYLCMLAGDAARGLDPANMFHMGPVFLGLAERILAIGCTPILIHHSTKHIEAGEPLELEQLAYAGVSEFGRQWLLLNSRVPYDPKHPGSHQLWLSVGGSEGQCGLWAMDVEEGELREDFSGRKWEVTVVSAGDAIEDIRLKKETARQEAKAQKIKEDGTAILNYLDANDPGRQGMTKKRIRDGLGWDSERMGRALQPLMDDGVVVECKVQVPTGTSTRPVDGVCRKPQGEPKEEYDLLNREVFS
jgi:hypothetical protein